MKIQSRVIISIGLLVIFSACDKTLHIPSSEGEKESNRAIFRPGRKVILPPGMMENPRGARGQVSPELAAGTKLVVISDPNCMSKNGPSAIRGVLSGLTSKNIVNSNQVLSVKAEEVTLEKGTTSAQLISSAEESPCVVGVALAQENEVSAFNAPGNVGRGYLEAIRFHDGENFWTKEIGNSRISVGIPDSGLDFKNKYFLPSVISNKLHLTNLLDRNDFPQDGSGHGTQLAGIIAATPNDGLGLPGLACNNVEIVPFRIVDTNGKTNNFLIHEAIVRAVNAGAKIINLSLSGVTRGCDPIVGDAIYRALDKEVMFVLSAGNGKKDQNGRKVGFELIPAQADGPTDFRETSSPACWGEYFRGAITVAAVENDRMAVPTFSNYGPAVEFYAPGVNISAFQLGGSLQLVSGTSPSAAILTSAAALTMSYFEKNSWPHPPELIESTLYNSQVTSELKQRYGLPLQGRVFDFERLRAYLNDLSQKSDNERRREFARDERDGQGWKPDAEYSSISRFEVFADRNPIYQGDKVQFRTRIYYRNGTSEDVTQRAIFSSADSRLFSIDDNGAAEAKISSDITKPVSYKVLAHFAHYQTAETTISVLPPDAVQRVLAAIQVQPVGPIRWGTTSNQFSVTASYDVIRRNKRESEIVDVTGESALTSSHPSEFIPTANPASFSTLQAYGGKTYSINASYGGKSASVAVQVPSVSAENLRIENLLGKQVFKGQSLSLSLRLVLNDGRDEDYLGTWLLDNQLLLENNNRVTINTQNLSETSHAVSVRAPFRGAGREDILSATIQFSITPSYQRLEILTGTPAIDFNQNAVFVARAYFANNSYTNVTSQAAWSSSDPILCPVTKNGIAYPSLQAKGKHFVISARFGSLSAEHTLHVIDPNAVLENITIHGPSEMAWMTADAGFSAIAHYSDGRVRDVTQFASWSSNTPQELRMNDHRAVVASCDVLAGKSYTIRALYEGKVAEHAVTTRRTPFSRVYVYGENPDRLIRGITYRIYSQIVTADSTITCPGSFSVLNNTLSLTRPTEGTSGVDMPTTDAPLGKHTIQFSTTYRGMGRVESVSGSVVLTINEAQYSHVEIFGDAVQSHGIGSTLRVTVYYQNGANAPINNWSDLESSITDMNDKPVADVWLARNAANLFSPRFFNYKTPGGKFKVRVKHVPSGLSSVHIVDTTGPSDNSPSYTANYPTISQLAPKLDSSFCDEQRKAAEPFAGGSGTQADPYLICSENQLINMLPSIARIQKARGCVTSSLLCERAYLELMRNLDFSSFGNLQPIKNDYHLNLDGNGYEIQNPTVVDKEKNNLGVFDSGDNSTLIVNNLGIRNPVIRGHTKVGALFGAHEQHIKNVYVVGGTVRGTKAVGGLIGFFLSGVGENLINQGATVHAENGEGGGLIGSVLVSQSEKGRILRSYSTGNVESIGVSSDSIGGLVGRVASSWDGFWNSDRTNEREMAKPLIDREDTIIIMDSFATGNVTTGRDGRAVGGLVGRLAGGILINTYATGHVVTTGSDVGGLVGVSFGYPCEPFPSRGGKRGIILSSHARGDVWGGLNSEGASNVGGLVGQAMCTFIGESSSSGWVRGINNLGGLLGASQLVNVGQDIKWANYNIIRNSRSTSKVTGSGKNIGGFIGGKLPMGDLASPVDYSFIPDLYIDNSWNSPESAGLPDLGVHWGTPNFDAEGIRRE